MYGRPHRGKSARPDLEDELDAEPLPYDPQPTPRGLNTRDPNAPKRQKRAADATPPDSSDAAEETGGDQGDNNVLLLEGNEVIKEARGCCSSSWSSQILAWIRRRCIRYFLGRRLKVSKKKYNNQYTSFKDRDNDLPHPDATYDGRATVLCLAAAYDGEVSFGKSELCTLKHNFTVRNDFGADVPGGQAAFIEYPDRVTTMWSARISVAQSSIHNYEADGTT
ncbi:hypothetical protein LTR49_025698 [Elasticomyces elasticus]|nr:hypothetical protein LTR49_025698 [Elasticomyces elasticus]